MQEEAHDTANVFQMRQSGVGGLDEMFDLLNIDGLLFDVPYRSAFWSFDYSIWMQNV